MRKPAREAAGFHAIAQRIVETTAGGRGFTAIMAADETGGQQGLHLRFQCQAQGAGSLAHALLQVVLDEVLLIAAPSRGQQSHFLPLAWLP